MSDHDNNVNSILLKGYYGFGNLGDDILMIVCYKILKQKYPGAVIKIFSNYTENLDGYTRTPGYNKYIHAVLGEEPELVDWTRKEKFDLVFNGGGGVFFDIRNGTFLHGFINRICARLGPNLVSRADRAFRRLLNKPHHIGFDRRVGFGIGIGPYAKRSRLYARHLAEIGSFNALFVRDDKSFQFLVSHGYNGSKFKYTDNAFLSDLWMPASIDVNWSRPPVSKLCVILQDLPARQQETFAALETFVSSLDGVEVTFLSFDRNHDKDYIKQFAPRRKLIVWEPDRMAISEFLSLFAAHDAVVTARAHGAILGAILGVVPITLGVSQKLVEVSGFFPEGGLLVENHTDQRAIAKAWEHVKQNYHALLAALHQDVIVNKEVAHEAMKKLFSIT